MAHQVLGAGFRLVAMHHGPGESAPFFIPHGEVVLRLQVEGPSRPGAGLRLMVGDDPSNWREVACFSTDDPLANRAPGPGVDCRFSAYASGIFGRIAVDWVTSAGRLRVSIGRGPMEQVSSGSPV